MFEYLAIGAIVAGAAAYLAWRFLRKKNRGRCGCGCSGCSSGAELKKIPVDCGSSQPYCGGVNNNFLK